MNERITVEEMARFLLLQAENSGLAELNDDPDGMTSDELASFVNLLRDYIAIAQAELRARLRLAEAVAEAAAKSQDANWNYSLDAGTDSEALSLEVALKAEKAFNEAVETYRAARPAAGPETNTQETT